MAKSRSTKKSTRDRKELQKKPNGDTAIYVRVKDELYTLFEKGWYEHIQKYDLNPSAYGVGSFIRDQAKRQMVQDSAASKG